MAPTTAVASLDGLHVVRSEIADGGAPVVLLHAIGLDLTWWNDLFRSTSDRTVVAYDQRGHGRSSAAPRGYALGTLADELLTILDTLGPSHVVGHSMGGMIAQIAAARRPGAMRSLALLATASRFGDAARAAVRRRAEIVRGGGLSALLPDTLNRWWPDHVRRRRPDLVDRCEVQLAELDAATHAACWDAIADLDLDRLPSIELPTLVLAGTSDSTTGPDVARDIASRIANAQVRIFEGAGHMLPFDSADEVNAQLAAHWRDNDA